VKPTHHKHIPHYFTDSDAEPCDSFGEIMFTGYGHDTEKSPVSLIWSHQRSNTENTNYLALNLLIIVRVTRDGIILLRKSIMF